MTTINLTIKQKNIEYCMKNIIRFGENHVELIFNQDWCYVQSIWEFIKGLLGVMIRNFQKVELISLCVVELAENAVKYSAKDKIGIEPIRILLTHDKKNKLLTITTENPADDENIKTLKTEIDRVMQKKEAQLIYLEKIKEVAERSDGKSQLGLIRIVYEGKAKLSMKKINHHVQVVATFSLEVK